MKELKVKLDVTREEDLFNYIYTFSSKENNQISKQSLIRLIKSREEKGSTYIGYNTNIYHIVSQKVKQDKVLYVYLKRCFYKKEFENEYLINKAIILFINPDHKIQKLKQMLNFILGKAIAIPELKEGELNGNR